MARFEIDSRYPDVLLLYGDDVYLHDFRTILDTLDASPVNLGSHDFWVIHSLGGGGHNSADCTIGTSRLKRCINLEYFISDSAYTQESATGYINGFLHEIGHYWLVPHFSMRLGRNGTIWVNTSEELEFFINPFYRSEPLPSFCLLAKENTHWNCFMDSGSTTFEALDWILQESIPLEGFQEEGVEFEHILRRYEVNPRPSYITGNVGSFSINAYTPYSDLDQVIMGTKNPNEAYSSNNNVFYELAPQWMSPIEMLSGICLVFNPTDVVQFGFFQGHEKIAIQRTIWGGSLAAEVNISDAYHPQEMWDFDSHMAFRVIKRGNDYYFQFKKEITSVGCLASILSTVFPRIYTPPNKVDIFSDLQSLPSVESLPQAGQSITDLNNWITLAIINESVQPLAAGYIVKTWGGSPPLVDSHFTPFQVKSGGEIRTVTMIADTEVTSPDYTDSLTDNFIFHKPHAGPTLLRGKEIANLIVGATTPTGEVGALNHQMGVDDAPKLLTNLPDGDFVMGGKLKLNRTAMATHAAGAAASIGTQNRKLWAFRRERYLWRNNEQNIQLDANSQRISADNSPYRCAFIIVARDRASITDTIIQNVETYRQACPLFFNLATEGRRSISITLS